MELKRLTKTYEDGTHGAADDLEMGENSYDYKNALIESLGNYEDLFKTPNQIKARLCKLDTYERADSDGRLVLILDKNGFCKELGMSIEEIREKCKK